MFDIVFNLRAQNDIDHLVPVIYRMRKDHPDLALKAVIHNLEDDYADDYRIEFLRSLEVPVEHLSTYLEVDAGYGAEYLEAARALRQPEKLSLPARWRARRLIRSRRDRLVRLREQMPPETFFDRALGRGTGGVSVFDITYNRHYQRLGEYANQQGIATVALPHSVNARACRTLSWDVDPPPPLEALWHRFVIYPNHHVAAIATGGGQCRPDQAQVLGSARFCAEWVEELRRILPPVTLPAVSATTLKIVMMMNKPKSVYQAEVDRVIQFLARFPDTCLIIKPHTRSEGYQGDRPANVHVAGSDMPSPCLIDWADVTLFPLSTVVFDGLRRDRPILFLKRVIQDPVFHEAFIRGWRIESIEELRDQIWALIKDRKHRTYTREERDRCLRELVEPAGPDVLGNYAAFLCRCLGR